MGEMAKDDAGQARAELGLRSEQAEPAQAGTQGGCVANPTGMGTMMTNELTDAECDAIRRALPREVVLTESRHEYECGLIRAAYAAGLAAEWSVD